MVIVIYHYVERIEEFLLPLIFLNTVYYHEKYYPGEPVNILIQLLMNIVQETNQVITTQKGSG